MIKKLLYIGNKLSEKGFPPTTIDTLGVQLAEFSKVHAVSDKRNVILRLFDMCISVFTHRKYDYAIIDTYSSSAFYYAFCVSICCRLVGLKYIPILHGGNLPNRIDRTRFLSKILFKNSYINVSPSNYLKDEFNRRGYSNVVTIHNNIALDKYTYKKRKAFSPNLLWVRSFANIYNCTMAVEVLNLLLKKYPQASLCMIGPDKDGSLKKTMDLAETYGISDKIKITGKLSKKEWTRLSQEYDIFISTTNFDNLPVSIIEAMALGLPVVSTNVGGMPYMIKDSITGYLVPKGDTKKMYDSIVRIIEDPIETMRICENAHDEIQVYNWDNVKIDWQRLLK